MKNKSFQLDTKKDKKLKKYEEVKVLEEKKFKPYKKKEEKKFEKKKEGKKEKKKEEIKLSIKKDIKKEEPMVDLESYYFGKVQGEKMDSTKTNMLCQVNKKKKCIICAK